MPNYDKNRIFNESPVKVLKREYENLKKDFSKLGAMQYKQYYESAPLSFILENSELIFTEPYRGLDFYKSIMENTVLPFNVVENEMKKVDAYYFEHESKMSEVQKSDYQSLISTLQNRYNSMRNSSCLYQNMMEGTENIVDIYDDFYQYTKENSEEIPNSITELMESEDINLLDTLNIVIGIPELHASTMEYLEACYYENPKTPEEYKLNAYTTNVISRMMKDSYFSERVSHIQNMNLRHFIIGLGGVKGSELMDNILIEKVKDYDPHYANTENSVNRIFEDDIYSELLEDVNTEEKINRFLCERAVLDMNLSFMAIDFLSEGTISPSVDSIVEQICVESTTIEKIPQDICGQMKLLQEMSELVDRELGNINEKYFSNDGSPSRVVANSVGRYGKDSMTDYKNKEKESEEPSFYTPKKREKEEHDSDTSEDDSDESHGEDNEEENDDVDKKSEAKKRRDDKYSNMDIDDDEFNSLTESKDGIEKPEKRPFFQRVQNKALDANVKFKKTVANGRRTAQDTRNAGKAIAKIPNNITSSVKKTLDDWEELDDNRRKEYMIQPGNRKKYFRALQLAIMHGVAWCINPLLNIVLAISHKLSSQKDERLKNELVRELKAEIKVTEEKIEDARGNGDNAEKYKLIRIKEKLNSELVLFGANSKFV